jgi:2-polyprenyl-6-methoxyphenol hydroxylase-like FAD-dependent oxidoreductase
LNLHLDIQYDKHFESFETSESGEIIAKFRDGTLVSGSLLIGADGSNSNVRRIMKMEKSSLTPLPVNLIGAVRHLTPEEAVPVRALNPLLFFAMHPETRTFFFYSIQASRVNPSCSPD